MTQVVFAIVVGGVILAVSVGGTVLAVVLLYRQQQRHGQLINELRAMFAAQEITRLRTANSEAVDDVPEPERRKRHLGLYLGGVMAAFTALGARARGAWQTHRPVSIAAATATSAAVAAVGMLYYGPIDTHDRGAAPSSPTPLTSAPLHPTQSPAPTPSDRPSSSAPSPKPPSATPTEPPSGASPPGGVEDDLTLSPTSELDHVPDAGLGGSTITRGLVGGTVGGATTGPISRPPPSPPSPHGHCRGLDLSPLITLCLLGSR